MKNKEFFKVFFIITQKKKVIDVFLCFGGWKKDQNGCQCFKLLEFPTLERNERDQNLINSRIK